MHAKTDTRKFSKQLRLLAKEDFQSVFTRASRFKGKGLMVFAARNSLGYSRLGLGISKKTLKLAVSRNRIKRKVRESFRHHNQSIKGYDLVVISRHGIAEQFGCIDSSLNELWKKLVEHCA